MYEVLYCSQCGDAWERKVVRGRKPSLCSRCKYAGAIVRTRRTKASGLLVLSDGGKSEAGFGSERNDCTVRAVAVACEVPYRTAYTFMSQMGRKRNKGAYFHGIITRTNGLLFGKRVVPDNYIKPARGLKTFLLRNPQLRRGTWMLHSTHHVSVLRDGKLIDSFDSSRKTFNGAWKVM